MAVGLSNVDEAAAAAVTASVPDTGACSGNADDMDTVEKEDGDEEGAVGSCMSPPPLLAAAAPTAAADDGDVAEDDGCIQEAKAARCNGRHPCRVSLIPAASGYNSTSKRMNRHTSINGSTELFPGIELACRSYKGRAR